MASFVAQSDCSFCLRLSTLNNEKPIQFTQRNVDLHDKIRLVENSLNPLTTEFFFSCSLLFLCFSFVLFTGSFVLVCPIYWTLGVKGLVPEFFSFVYCSIFVFPLFSHWFLCSLVSDISKTGR